MKVQVKRFDDYQENALDKLNEFILDKKIVDIKQNIVTAVTGSFYSQYLVIYKVEEVEK